MAWNPPNSAMPIAVRPLDKGVRLDASSLLVPDGSMLLASNFIANQEGYRRRPGYGSFAGADTVPYRMVDAITVYDDSGDDVALLLTDTSLYLVDPWGGFTEVAWAYSTGTVTVSGGSITGSGTTWLTNGIKAGDLIRIGASEARVLSVPTETSLTVASGSFTNGSGLSYSIQRTFYGGMTGVPVWAKTPDGIAIADGKHELLRYDYNAGTLGYWITSGAKNPPNGATVPAVVAFIGDRVFMGYTSDAVDGVQPQNYIWSGLADIHDFNFTENYNKFATRSGRIVRALALGDLNVVYTSDGVYVGQPTNYPTAPYRYVALETGPLGLVGPYAVAPYLGGHFLISQNGFYFTDGSAFQEISQPIARDIQSPTVTQFYDYVCADPLNYSIMFGVARVNKHIDRIYRIDPRSKSWSWDDLPTEMIANPTVNAQLTWAALSGLTWATLGATYPTWDSMQVSDIQRRVLIEQDSALWRGTQAGGVDFAASAIAASLITKDHDFGEPDINKTCVRLGIKIDAQDARTTALVFRVYGSVNRGRTEKLLGNLIIAVDRDEGYINFALLGSTMRFRLSTNTQEVSYTITEYTVRVRGSGEELNASMQA